MDAYVGEIRLFAGTFAPVYWLFCWGQTVDIYSYEALYSIIGNTYGGTPPKTFALPDFRGRVPIHQGTGPGLSTYLLGHSGGSATVPLISSQLPSHTHTVNANYSETSPGTSPENALWSITAGRNGAALYNDTANTALSPAAISASGGSQPHNNMQPFVAINYIISAGGLYPIRPN